MIFLKSKNILVLFLLLLSMTQVRAWEGMSMPQLHVEGCYLKDSSGHIVNLHGFAQTYSPWFNEQNTKWSNYDVEACLKYNQGIIDKVLDAGWKMNFVRMHMDPYWSNSIGCTGRYEGEECFNESRFKKYLDEVFVPMAEYAVSKGLYVVMRPPGVCPEQIEVGGVYHNYLIKVWSIVSKHPKLAGNLNIMFELANEPIHILGTDGTYGSGTQGHFDNLKTYFQTIVDTIRTNAENILWIPGLGYQSQYAGYATNPIEGQNIGYAIHVYPGWFNSGQGYEPFQKGWDNQVQPVADFAPIMVTEMDWAPERHDKSWGKDSTGTAGGNGFGANFKKIVDDCGNVSWLLFTTPDLLAEFGNDDAPADVVDFLTDEEACPWPIYHWFEEYAEEYQFDSLPNGYLEISDLQLDGDTSICLLNRSSESLKVNAIFGDGHIERVGSVVQASVDNPDVVEVSRGRIFAMKDGHALLKISYSDAKGNEKEFRLNVSVSTFPLTNDLFDADIWEDGSFDETTRTVKTGQWGFAGWQYDGIDLSDYKYIVARLAATSSANVAFRVFDGASYWGSPASYSFGSKTEVVVRLNEAKKEDGTLLNPQNIYIAGFWSNGNSKFVIDSVFVTNSSEYDIPVIFAEDLNGSVISRIDSLSYTETQGPSASKSFLLSADMLKDKLIVEVAQNFEISLSVDGEYTSSLEFAPQDGVLAETQIFVRLKAGLSRDTYQETLNISSTDAVSKKIVLNGIVEQPSGNDLFEKSGEVVSIEYFSIMGQKLKSEELKPGVVIERVTMSTGVVINNKVLVKNTYRGSCYFGK